MKILQCWREISMTFLALLVFILGLTLSFIVGRGHESEYVRRIMVDESIYVQRLIIEKQQLLQLKQQTNQLLNQVSWNAQSRQSWESLGYVFPDSTR